MNLRFALFVSVLVCIIFAFGGCGRSSDPYGEGMRVYFFNVGQGDAALAVSEGAAILFDAGTNENEERLIAYIERLGIKSIDCMVLSHPHDDHIGGADAVIEAFDVETVIMPDIEADEKSYYELLGCIEDEDCAVYEAYEGEVWQFGDMSVTVLSPWTQFGDANLDGAVVRLDYGETSFLFTGDCEGEAEALLTERAADALDCDVLKVGHHGSDNASSDAFLGAVSPQIAVISCGEYNEYGHPHTNVLSRLSACGAAIARTDRDGTVTVESYGEAVRIVE